MGLPTNQDLRTAFTAFGQLVQAAGYYAQSGATFTDAERQSLQDNLELLTRGNITPLEVLDRATALPITPFFTAARPGMYLIIGYFILSNVANAGTATVTLTWNDGKGTRSEAQLSSVSMTVAGQKTFMKPIVLAQGQSVSAQISYTGVTGSPLYSIYARIIEF